MALNRKGGPWPGAGYISIGKGGRETYVIERMIRKRRFHISTHCSSRRAAEKQFERFQADPFNYKPEGEKPEAVLLTSELATEFVLWMRTKKKNTLKYCRASGKTLEGWIEDIGTVDLRKLSLRDHILPALKERPGTRHRMITIKSFMAWMRRVKHLVTSGEDATLDLQIPQPPAAKNAKRKAVDWETVRAAGAQLTGGHLDMLQILIATGMHVTELERFIRLDEAALVVPLNRTIRQGRRVLAVLVTPHKSGEHTRIPLVEAEHVAAAERLRAGRVVPRKLNKAIAEACERAGVPRFTGGVMRHSVATWAIDKGAMPEVVSQFLGHKDKRTTLKFYADVRVPTATVPTNVMR